MTKKSDPRGGGGGGFGRNADETKKIQKANDKGKDIKREYDEERARRIMLKSNPPKSAPRITLRAKQGELSKAPSKSDRQRAPTRETTTTPTRSPHTTLKSKAGELHFSRRTPTTRIKVSNDLVLSKVDSQSTSNEHLSCKANSCISPSRKIEPAEHADFEHLSDPSQVTGPNAFLVKVLSEKISMHEDRDANWELIGYPRPVTPVPVSITPICESTRTIGTFTKVHNAAIKVSQPSKDSDFRSLTQDKIVVRSAEKSEEDLESRIRSILTEPNRAQRRADIKSQGSVKSVKWDPSIISLGPVASAETTTTKVKQPGARSNRQSLDDSIKEFTDTVKDLKKGDRRILAELLEALRNVESDDDSTSDLTDKKERPETSTRNLYAPMTTRDELPKSEASSSDRTPEGSVSKSNEREISGHKPHAHVPTAASVKEQKTYRDAFTSGVIQPNVSTQATNRERSKSLSSDETTIVGSEDMCIKATQTPGLRATTKLNPCAPVFAGFGQTKHKATRSDPLEELHPFITTIQKRHRSCDDGYDGLKQAAPTVAKVEKYVPPALRGDRKFHLPEKKFQEPVWVRVQEHQSPNMPSDPVLRILGGFERIKTSDDNYHQGLEDPVLNHGLAEKQNQTEWLNQWLRDAAKPDHGPGIHLDPHPAPQQVELHGPCYGQAVQDFALATQVHEDTTAMASDLLGPLPIEWASAPFSHMMQYPNLPAEYYPIRPLPIVGPLITIPPPLYFGQQPLVQGAAPMQLPLPLIPEPSASKVLASSEGKAGRVAKPLDSAWADKVLGNFMSKFPMTGKCQSSFPAPPIQELDTKAAQIQQKLELLILKQKEKKAYERRFRGSSQGVSNDRNLSVSTQSTNLISFD